MAPYSLGTEEALAVCHGRHAIVDIGDLQTEGGYETNYCVEAWA
jgi:hypothetical protein